ncbi:MAG: phage shock protein PspA [Desulfovibrionales bacterium]
MGIFTRFKDIVSSNINSMLDRAEDPEKMIRLMIREMEETLVELKASCASSMAAKKRLQRELESLQGKTTQWHDRARLAVEKGRDDLGREALIEKKRLARQIEVLESDLVGIDGLVEQCQEDIVQLEEKLATVKEKQRLLVKRHTRAKERKKSRSEVRMAESQDAFSRFESFQQQVERMESEAELEGPLAGPGLESEFRRLEGDEDVELELQQLKEQSA